MMPILSRRSFLTGVGATAASLIARPSLAMLPSQARFSPDLKLFPKFRAATPGVAAVMLSSGGIVHRFFDTSPISPSGRYVALFRLPREDRGPKPGEAGQVVIVDLKNGHERVVATSRGYEMQLGAQVQWGITDEELYFNDVDPETWKAFAVKLNPATGKLRRMDGTVFTVSADGRRLASYNLVSSRYAQVGYGVMVPDSHARRNFGPVDDDGIDITDIVTGRTRRIVTIRDIYERSAPRIKIPNPDDFEFYCFQVKWNPQGTRLLTTIQWSARTDKPAGEVKGVAGRARAVITMRPDGSDLRTAITPEQWAPGGHHVNWMADGEHLSMNLCLDGKPGLKVIQVRADGTELRSIFDPGSGHPSQRPGGGPFFVTDAYPTEPVTDRDGTSPIRLLNTSSGREQTLAKIFVSMVEGERRIDPHPAWDRTGRYVVFNGFQNGTRNVYLMDLAHVLR